MTYVVKMRPFKNKKNIFQTLFLGFGDPLKEYGPPSQYFYFQDSALSPPPPTKAGGHICLLYKWLYIYDFMLKPEEALQN